MQKRDWVSLVWKSFADKTLFVRSQQVRKVNVELDDEVSFLARIIGMRHSFARHRLPVAWTVNNKHKLHDTTTN